MGQPKWAESASWWAHALFWTAERSPNVAERSEWGALRVFSKSRGSDMGRAHAVASVLPVSIAPSCACVIKYFFRASPEGRTGVSSYTGEGRHYFFCGAFKNRFLWTDAGVDDLTTSVLTCKICGLDKNLRFCSCTWWFVYYCADVEGPEENLRPERASAC